MFATVAKRMSFSGAAERLGLAKARESMPHGSVFKR